MHNPPHPGEVLRDGIFAGTGITVTEFARRLVVTRVALSRALFARYLRINLRTLENWEQGRARPNAQAALLIRLVERFPDTVDRLARI